MINKFTKEEVEEKMNRLSKIKFDDIDKESNEERVNKIFSKLSNKEISGIETRDLVDKYEHYEDDSDIITRTK